jgi:hypothetical protein
MVNNISTQEAAMATQIPEYLLSPDACEHASSGICYGLECRVPVKQNPATERWFITMGHPGFNSPANNGRGYASGASARAAMLRYGSR